MCGGGGNNDWLMRFSRGGDNLKINPILENDLFETERGGGEREAFRCEWDTLRNIIMFDIFIFITFIIFK